MDILAALRAAQTEAVVARDFEARFSITMPFSPGWPPDQHRLDLATAFALDPARSGRSRRTVDASAGETTWSFEMGEDATEFALTFP